MRIQLWFLLVLFWFLYTEIGHAENRLLRVTYLANSESLDWTTQESNKKPAVAWDIFFRSRTMTGLGGRRLISQEEADVASKSLQNMVDFVKAKVVSGQTVSFSWVAASDEVEIQVQENTGLRMYRVTATGELYDEDTKLKTPEDWSDIAYVLFDAIDWVIKYCIDSTIWWFDGKGEPVNETKAQALFGLGVKDAGAPPEGPKLAGNVVTRSR